MARPQKKGVDYFPFDVGFFDDRKIKELKGKFGADGIMVYTYLLCLIYKENGYYIQLDDGFNYVASSDLNMDSGKIAQIIDFLCKRFLFDSALFSSRGILTSRGVQLRFQEAVKARGAKNEIKVNGDIWLLDEAETRDYILAEDYSENNTGFSREKPSKENKEKENKENEITAVPYGGGSPELKNIIDVYEKNIAPITDIVKNSIIKRMKDVDADVIIYAINEAAAQNVRKWAYINAVIENHLSAGRKTLAEIEASRKTYSSKNSGFNIFSAPDYDFDELEKLLRKKYDGTDQPPQI